MLKILLSNSQNNKTLHSFMSKWCWLLPTAF